MTTYLEHFNLVKRTKGELKASELAGILDTHFYNNAPKIADSGDNIVKYYPDTEKYSNDQILDAVGILRADPKYSGVSIAYTQEAYTQLSGPGARYVCFLWLMDEELIGRQK